MKFAAAFVFAFNIGLCAACWAAEPLAPIDFEREDGQIAILSAGKPVATFVFEDPEIPRPYFANLHAPGGVQISRRHPVRKGVDADDHALMHPGLWLAFGDLSGADSWRLKSPVEFIEFVDEPEVIEGVLRFTARFRYRATTDDDAAPLAEELCRIAVRNSPEGYWIEYDSTLSPLGESLVFGDQEEMGLGIRAATEITVKAGGQIASASGQLNEKEVWGKTSLWCDYRGAVGERLVGILIAPHPENFRPCWFHARDYGVLVANPFGRKAFTGGEPSQVEINAGDSLRLRFAVLLHASPLPANLPANQPASQSATDAIFDGAKAYSEAVERWTNPP
jgi:hypothetical protein